MMGLDSPKQEEDDEIYQVISCALSWFFFTRLYQEAGQKKTACGWSVYFTSQTRIWEEEYTFPTHFAISSSERLRFSDYIWTTNWPYLLMCDAWMRPIKYNHVLLSKQPQFRHKIYEPYLTSRVQEFKLLPFSRQNSKRASRSLLLCNLSYIRDISVAHNLAFLRTATEPAGC